MGSQRNTRILLAFLLVVSVSLIALDARGREFPGRGLVSTVIGPLQSATTSAVNPIRSLFADLRAWPSLREDNDRLRQENDTLRGQVASIEQIRNRASQLDALLRIAGQGSYRIVAAQVVAFGATQDYSRTVTLDAGSRDGIRRGMTVIAGRGLVGTIAAVSPTTSTVVLISDPNSRVGSRTAETSHIGVVLGDGESARLRLQFLVDAQPVVGQRVVTRGSAGGRPYVAGVPIGRIISVGGTVGQLRTAVVEPYVDLGALDVVGVVVTPPRRDPRDAVLPEPPPTPTVTATITVTATPVPTPDATVTVPARPSPTRTGR